MFSGRRPGPTGTAAIGAILLALQFIPLPDVGRAVNALLDCAHAPAFAILAYLLFRLFSAQPPQQFSIRFWTVLVGTVLLGMATEVAQQRLGRTTSLQDAGSNLLGVAAGALWFRHEARPTGMRRRSIAVVLVVVSWVLPACILVDVFRQRQNMPLIASFEDGLELSRWSRQNCEWTRTTRHASHGRSALYVRLEPSIYPGITLHTPVADWSSYETLVFDAFVEEAAAIQLVLKVEDAAHTGEVRDRYNGRIHLAPGATSIRVPLSEIAAAPEERQLEMSRISKLQLFAVRPSHPRSFFLDNMRLE